MHIASQKLNETLVQKVTDMVKNYEFSNRFQKDFEGFSRDHEKDSQGDDWETKVNKMTDSDFFVEGLLYRKKQREAQLQLDMAKREYNEKHKNELKKQLIAQKIAIERKDFDHYNDLGVMNQTNSVETSVQLEQNEYLDQYIDDRTYQEKLESQDLIKKENYEFSYSEYNDFWEDFEEDPKQKIPVRKEVVNVKIQENELDLENGKVQEKQAEEQPPVETTFVELEKYPAKFDELDQKFDRFRRDTYKTNLVDIEQHYIKRIKNLKKAVRMQLRYGRQQARDKAKKILTESVINLTQLFKNELNAVIESFSGFRSELRTQDKQINELKNVIKEQEFILVQMNNYIAHAGLTIGFDQEMLKRMRIDRKANARKGNTKPNEILQQQIGTLPEFNFYSFYVNMTLTEDRNQLIHQEMIDIMEEKIIDLETRLSMKEHELFSFKGMQEVYDLRDDHLRQKVAELEGEIDEKNRIITENQRRLEEELLLQLNTEIQLKLKTQKQLQDCLDMTKQEMEVNEQIKDKQQKVIIQLKQEMKDLKTILKIPRLRNMHINKMNFEELQKLKSQEQFYYENLSQSDAGLTDDLNRFHAYLTSAPAHLPQQRGLSSDRKYDDPTLSSDIRKRAQGIFSESNSSKGFETERGSAKPRFPSILGNKDSIVQKLLSQIDKGVTQINIKEMQKSMTRNNRIKESMSYSQLPSVQFNFDSLLTTHDVSKNIIH
ncbi:UNKNOWN [Stylonychia lemnae]|uniref:Uncharacterized protein n=1 Tax=Stylonychia lemnae TaxID=5949 RepID=A0A078B203_STYLE|nr:UNKNOWN [Stylonychia lemnae]|eukprot:CDW87317.1 UNKNOWN [Stylonychia lemnae]